MGTGDLETEVEAVKGSPRRLAHWKACLRSTPPSFSATSCWGRQEGADRQDEEHPASSATAEGSGMEGGGPGTGSSSTSSYYLTVNLEAQLLTGPLPAYQDVLLGCRDTEGTIPGLEMHCVYFSYGTYPALLLPQPFVLNFPNSTSLDAKGKIFPVSALARSS